MAVRTLNELYIRFVVRSKILADKYKTSLPYSGKCRNTICQSFYETVHCDARAQMIVRLQFLWGEFCREIIIRSALGGYKTVGGNILKPVATANVMSVIEKAVNKARSGRPVAWHRPRFAVDVGKSLGIQNYKEIALALTSVAPFDDLLVVRNYVVHPSKETRMAFERLTWKLSALGTDPVTLLAIRRAGGATYFETWVADFQTIAFQAVQ